MTYKFLRHLTEIELLGVVLEKQVIKKKCLRCILEKRHLIVSRNIRFVQALHLYLKKINRLS